MNFLLKQVLLPPASLMLIFVVGLIILRKRGDIGWWMAVTSAAFLYILSTPIGSSVLSRLLETETPLSIVGLAPNQADAIVILGSDSEYAEEFGGETVGIATLARLRYGAQLHARTGLPILVSGGPLDGDNVSLAEHMEQVLTTDYGVPTGWVENQSRNTWENAVNSAAILRAGHISRIYLVIQARDMARAAGAFRQAGLEVVPAPIGFQERRANGWRNVVPSAKSLLVSYYALYEIAGSLEYSVIHPQVVKSD